MLQLLRERVALPERLHDRPVSYPATADRLSAGKDIKKLFATNSPRDDYLMQNRKLPVTTWYTNPRDAYPDYGFLKSRTPPPNFHTCQHQKRHCFSLYKSMHLHKAVHACCNG